MNDLPIRTTDSRLRILTEGSSHFFGFHDLTPWNPSGSRLVCLRTDLPETRIPSAIDEADLVVVDDTDGMVQHVATSRAWNWQQGARQQWLSDDEVVFNDDSGEALVACVVDVRSSHRHYLGSTISDVNTTVSLGVTVNFERLSRLYPAYGYASRYESGLRDPNEDGLFLVPLGGGPAELVLSIEEASRTTFGEVLPRADFLTHATFSPSGDHIAVLHRRNLPGGALSTNLIVMDVANRSWKVIADDFVSHFDWEDEEHIVVWCRKNRAMSRMKRSRLRPLLRLLYPISRRITGRLVRRAVYGECFRRFNISSGANAPFGLGVITEDGHPMVNPQHRHVWVNDTYPSPEDIQTLMVFHSGTNERIDLLRLPTPSAIARTDWRCDFHPRWDPDGERICIDSAHLGRRQLCIVDASEPVARLLASA